MKTLSLLANLIKTGIYYVANKLDLIELVKVNPTPSPYEWNWKGVESKVHCPNNFNSEWYK